MEIELNVGNFGNAFLLHSIKAFDRLVLFRFVWRLEKNLNIFKPQLNFFSLIIILLTRERERESKVERMREMGERERKFFQECKKNSLDYIKVWNDGDNIEGIYHYFSAPGSIVIIRIFENILPITDSSEKNRSR